jgi:hypothetical protein
MGISPSFFTFLFSSLKELKNEFIFSQFSSYYDNQEHDSNRQVQGLRLDSEAKR